MIIEVLRQKGETNQAIANRWEIHEGAVRRIETPPSVQIKSDWLWDNTAIVWPCVPTKRLVACDNFVRWLSRREEFGFAVTADG